MLERRRHLRGIVNGIDYDVFNPMKDTYLTEDPAIREAWQQFYDRKDESGQTLCLVTGKKDKPDHLISQLFFDNNAFYDFIEKVRIAGINVPVEAGIMPVTNKKQIERMVSMCGASIPAKLSKLLQKFGDDHIAMRDAGISYAVDQIIDLVANGVDGVHIYTMNDPYVAKRISDSVANIIKK